MYVVIWRGNNQNIIPVMEVLIESYCYGVYHSLSSYLRAEFHYVILSPASLERIRRYSKVNYGNFIFLGNIPSVTVIS